MRTIELMKISFDNEKKLDNDRLFMFNIFSSKAAIFLNYFLNFQFRKACRYVDDYAIGGGLFVKGDPRICINDIGEVGIYFRNFYGMSSNIRTNPVKSDYIKIIQEKIANNLKAIFKEHSKDNNLYIPLKFATFENNEKLKFAENTDIQDECVVITKNEYRCIYEFLKGRIKDKTINKYGNEAYTNIVGKKIEDQFVLSAIEVIKAEIKKANEEFAQAKSDIQTDFNNKYKLLRNEFDEKNKACIEQNKAKIEELSKQLEAIKNMTPTM